MPAPKQRKADALCSACKSLKEMETCSRVALRFVAQYKDAPSDDSISGAFYWLDECRERLDNARTIVLSVHRTRKEDDDARSR